MLLIILLGAITKLAVGSDDCQISAVHTNFTDWTNFTGTWYLLYHIPHKYDDNMDCPMVTYKVYSKTTAKVITYIYVKSTHTRDRFVGNILDWNANGYYDIYYPEPSPDTHCAANETCTVNQYMAKMWSGRYHALSVGQGRYLLFEYCCKHLNTLCIYVAFRTPNPEEEILDDVKKDLKKYDLDFNQLVKWDVNHCKQKNYREHGEKIKGKN